MSAKFWSIVATVGFGGFWVFGALAVVGVFTVGALNAVEVSLAALCLAIGADARARVERMTRSAKVGTFVRQAEDQHA